MRSIKRARDIVVASIHWGGNWGYTIARAQQAFARRLLDDAGVDVIHAHSSHHPKAIEIYKDKPILYGCGDFLNDYEGIGGYEAFRGELGLMYFLDIDPASGKLIRFALTPTRIKWLRINRASAEEARWLANLLQRESQKFAVQVLLNDDNSLALRWNATP